MQQCADFEGKEGRKGNGKKRKEDEPEGLLLQASSSGEVYME